MKSFIQEIIFQSIVKAKESGKLSLKELPAIMVEKTAEEKFGDFTTNISMIIASQLKEKPRSIAQIIIDNIFVDPETIGKIEIAGPGFINFFMSENFWFNRLKEVDGFQENFGKSDIGKGEKIQIEFVSANPTGPLHVGHGRGAVVGDVLANILIKAGYQVEKEYYINDQGNQMNQLGRSTYIRYQQILGRNLPFPEEGYQGEYVFDIAREIIKEKGEVFKDKVESECLDYFIGFSGNFMLEKIKEDLGRFGVEFDSWVSEKGLHQKGEIKKCLELLREKDLVYEQEGALWLKSSQFGDEKDRVILKGNNDFTYFASDIAYHKNKFDRGFSRIIDIWGADHHGYIPRIRSIIQAMEYPIDKFKVILVQLVHLKREGKEVSMSKRSGEFITLRDVLEEVGKDACRLIFLMRSSDAHLDFDLDLAKKESKENPVYYIQYAFARISSVLRLAAENNIRIPEKEKIDLSFLKLKEEQGLVKQIDYFPDLVAECAQSLEPHRLAYYLQDLAGRFHVYYYQNRIISEDSSLTLSRLFLVKCLRIVFLNGLKILGVTAPEKM